MNSFQDSKGGSKKYKKKKKKVSKRKTEYNRVEN